MATARAHPTKLFFIESLVRDLSVEDAILDLVDNSVDSLLVRKHDFKVASSMLSLPPREETSKIPDVILEISDEEFRITDLCGGIDRKKAEEEIFRLGFVRPAPGSLSVFGIGLKRAIFKIGKQITIESKTTSGGFKVDIDVDTWIKSDETWEDWAFPLFDAEAAVSDEEAGTQIIITQLNPEIVMKFKAGTFLTSLQKSIALTYSLFLQQVLTVSLNGDLVVPATLPLASSSQVEYGHKKLEIGEVQIDIYTSLAPRIAGEWNIAIAGWYVFCNGRIVVAADKTVLTGWGDELPIFSPKFRGFIGIVFFFSDVPSALPWTTTKRGLNQDSYAYQVTKKEMLVEGRRVISFLNKMYPGDPREEVPERKAAETVDVVQMGNTCPWRGGFTHKYLDQNQKQLSESNTTQKKLK
jgi:hypothetical protein